MFFIDSPNKQAFFSPIGFWQLIWYIVIIWLLLVGILYYIYDDHGPQEKALYSYSIANENRGENTAGNSLSITIHPVVIVKKTLADDEKPSSGQKKTPDQTDYHSVRKGFFEFETTEQLTIKEISRLFYGDNRFFPVVLMHNSHIRYFDVEKGTRIRVLKNSQMSKEIYENNIEIIGENVHWVYTVEKNDTINGIARKFYGNNDSRRPVVDLNPEIVLKQGEKVMIMLE